MHMLNRLSVAGGQAGTQMYTHRYNGYLTLELKSCGGSTDVAAIKVHDVAQP